MRIIGGRLKGRRLSLPGGIRPTSDKVRKALFDILDKRVVNVDALDLFAGSGSLGIEALSRGAKVVIFVEKERKCVERIKENLVTTGLGGCRVIHLDVFTAIKMLKREGEKFDLIFLDPPYYKDIVKKSLQIFLHYDILRPSGLIVAEHYKKDQLPKTLGELTLMRQCRYGDTVLSFYQMKP